MRKLNLSKLFLFIGVLLLIVGISFIGCDLLNIDDKAPVNTSPNATQVNEVRDTVNSPVFCVTYDTTFVAEKTDEIINYDATTGKPVYQKHLVTARVYKMFFNKYYRLNEAVQKTERVYLPAEQYTIINQTPIKEK